MRNRVLLGVLGFLTLAGLIGAACGGASHTSASMPSPQSAVLRANADTAVGAPAAVPSPAFGAAGANGSAGSTVPILTQRVVKTADITLRLRDGTFDQRFQDAAQIAGRFGGFVSSSQSAAGKRRSGTLVIRIPVSQFESALGALKGLGRVTGERVSGQDVTAQFVDLQARLRNWQAQESVLLGLMQKATSIQDSIRVQNQLQDVQLSIEEIKGQLRVLSDQSDYSTITVGMAEAGFVAPQPRPSTSSLVRAWHRAVDGFVAVIAAVVIGLGYLLPLSILAALLWLVVRRARPKVARPA